MGSLDEQQFKTLLSSARLGSHIDLTSSQYKLSRDQLWALVEALASAAGKLFVRIENCKPSDLVQVSREYDEVVEFVTQAPGRASNTLTLGKK